MKWRKVAALGMAAVMTAGVLAGCGGDSDATTAAPTTKEAEATKAADKTEAPTTKGEETTAAEGNELSKDPVTLKVAMWDYTKTSYYKTMFAGFTEKYPNVTIEPVELDADNYEDVITTHLSAKADIDVVFMKSMPGLSALIDQGHVAPINDFLDKDKDYDASSYSGLVDYLTIEGKVYGLPFRKDNNIIYYNKDMFDAAGVEYPKDGMTMEEYYELAKKMTSGEGANKVYGAYVHTWAGNGYMYAARLGQMDKFTPEKYDVLKDYYELFLKMSDEGIIMDYGSAKTNNISYRDMFWNQQCAMMQMGTFQIGNLLDEEKDSANPLAFNWGVCSLPNFEGEGNTTGVGGVTPVSVGAYANNPEWAYELVSYLCGEEGAKVLASTGILPGFTSDAINQEYAKIPDTYKLAPKNLADYIDLDTYYCDEPMVGNGKAAGKAFDEVHSAIMTGSVGVEEGIQQMKEKVQEQLDLG